VDDGIMTSGAAIRRVLAANPGPMTLEGTNTWVVGAEPAVVIDPGPDDETHLAAVRAEAGAVGAILLTHRHPDHAPGAAALARATGAPVYAWRPEPGESPLRAGQETVAGGGLTIVAVHTPGHTPDHVVFFVPSLGALFTGDAVLGRGTSVIDPPEGDLAAYLRSLDAMIALAPRTIYPGHGPAVWAAAEKLAEYRAHREERERQVLDALAEGPRTPDEIVQTVYVDYPPELHALAARSVLAHLLKLEREGRAAHVGPPRDERFEAATPAACRRCGRPAMPRSTLCARCSAELLQEGPSPDENPGAST
jgi:glyoxylase-like metal-dependent hydrolase (beta-lactamase superfamily II)